MKEVILAMIGAGTIPAILTSIVTIITNKQNAKKEDLEKSINQVQLDNCKNYLVQAIARADNKGLTKVEQERYWENYDKYISLGGNSYIHSETERLKKEGKI